MDAAKDLHRAFRERADGVSLNGAQIIGWFGDGVPYPFLQSTGATCADVKAPPLADERDGPHMAAVTEIAESFLDDFAARFLHRFAAGAFDHFSMIVFARDDVAGLAAYQYASELRRQGMVSSQGPDLHLWNLLHTDTDAAHRFNMTELGRLSEALAQIGLHSDDARLHTALAHESERRQLLDGLNCNGADRFVYRAAGRWLVPETHITALKSVQSDAPGPKARKIGIVGTACDTLPLREACSELADLETDLMPFGDVWPYETAGVDSAESLIKAIAIQPMHIRVNPADRFCAALLARLQHCDVVIAAMDRNDDSFGWEIPRLREQITAKGARFVNLGFMPFRPTSSWIEPARAQILEALQ